MITEKEIEELAEILMQSENLSASVIIIKQFLEAALQNKVSDVSTEDFADPATPESTANWQKIADKDEWLDEVRGRDVPDIHVGEIHLKVSDVSVLNELEWLYKIFSEAKEHGASNVILGRIREYEAKKSRKVSDISAETVIVDAKFCPKCNPNGWGNNIIQYSPAIQKCNVCGHEYVYFNERKDNFLEKSRIEGVLLGLKLCKEMWAQGVISHEMIYENEIYYKEELKKINL